MALQATIPTNTGGPLSSQPSSKGKNLNRKGSRAPKGSYGPEYCALCNTNDHRTPKCVKYVGAAVKRKRLRSLKKCPNCTRAHNKGNCVMRFKCRICLDGWHLDYLCPGPKTPNATKRLTDGLGRSSKLTEVTKGQDLTDQEEEALDSKEVISIGKKEDKTDPVIGVDQKQHAELQEKETKINEQKLQIADLNSKLEDYALEYDNVNSQLQMSTGQVELALQTTTLLQNTLLDQHTEMNNLLTNNRQKDLQLEHNFPI